ncbi:transcriptional regulator, TetR family [Desulfovibrio sp. DV]|uniref:TetR/AcrR family transcriptional regulator n=1 Tax=Desulfovibrio sp. DV TaxID=1844708 RepID=UPI00094BC091|nr:TetR/AcrR family transcriptional regulator [Desulfovibrio sp. DV]OLN29638.1 transcriptional regulator, TetR family [Desulfovibrio sp. DV]
MDTSHSRAARAPKDREATKRRLIAAVGRVLARQGFRAVGVNTVAREAGVDKVLIYRYFDGLPGLVAAFSREGDFWPDVDELAGGDRQAFLALSFTERMVAASRNYLRAIRSRPLTQEILSWRFLEHNELTEALDTTRAEVGQDFLELVATGVALPPVDLTAFRALIGAAIHHLVVRELHEPNFAGLPLDNPASWDRLEAMIGRIIRGALGPE